MKELNESLQKLRNYIEFEQFKGYDPYDTLNSVFPILCFGKWPAVLATQFQKRNPFNIRPFLGIKKIYSTKGMGLLLKAYIKLYILTNNKQLVSSIEFIKDWLIDNRTFYNEDFCWGYDYPYSTPKKQTKKGFPTVIHHSYIIDGLYEYYKFFGDQGIRNIIIEGADFIINNIPIIEIRESLCFGYNPQSEDCCYNASLHAAKCLAIADKLNQSNKYLTLVERAIDFVVTKQKDDGVWYYSEDIEGNERKQIDFHQGFIIESIYDVIAIIGYSFPHWQKAIKKGLCFYKEKQFFSNGQSKWRLPKIYPVDIHNQAQGIITFSKLNNYDPSLLSFAETIVNWTISNMQSKLGYFYYRNFRYYKNRISYMRWSQAWMLLALTEFLSNKKESEI
jgi:hypothetical protein